MKIELLAFLLIFFLLFFVFNGHIQENFAQEIGYNSENRISLASLVVATPLYVALPELPIVNYYDDFSQINAESLKIGVIGENSSIYSFKDTIHWPIASLTKLLTSIVAIENLGLDRVVEIDLQDILTEGNALNLKTGEIFSVHDLIVAMLTVSSNDAAFALARTYGYDNFIQAMNDKAFALGMRNSSFSDSSGLSMLNQSTAVDLEKLANYIFKNYPKLLEISSKKENSMIELGSREVRRLKNINKFAGDADFIGGKTGYIEEARGNLLSIFNWQDRNVLIIVLGSDDRFLETSKLYNWVKNKVE